MLRNLITYLLDIVMPFSGQYVSGSTPASQKVPGLITIWDKGTFLWGV